LKDVGIGLGAVMGDVPVGPGPGIRDLAIMDLLAIDRDLAWGLDTQPHTAASDTDHLDCDISTDDDGLTDVT
jgi:hypothetical protein